MGLYRKYYFLLFFTERLSGLVRACVFLSLYSCTTSIFSALMMFARKESVTDFCILMRMRRVCYILCALALFLLGTVYIVPYALLLCLCSRRTTSLMNSTSSVFPIFSS